MRRRHRISIALIATAAVVGPVAEASAVTRYATPNRFQKTPGAAPCTDPAKPCILVTALAQAVNGDEVQLAAGNYYKSNIGLLGGPPTPYNDTIVVPEGVTLRGISPTSAFPTIHVAPDSQAEPGVELRQKAVIRDVAIAGSAKPNTPIAYSLSTSPNAVAERVRVTTTGAPGAFLISCSITAGSTIRSSVCLGRGTAADGKVTALSASSPNGTTSIRNVTAITTAEASVGLNFGTSNGTVIAQISNTIFRGTAADVSVRAGLAGGNARANVDHTNWTTQTVSAANGGSAVLDSLGGNQSGPTAVDPIFLDAAKGDFRQAAGSPTIDAGVVDAANNGALALGGANRMIGKTTDIGADEFDPTKVAPTPDPTAPTIPGEETPGPGGAQPPLSSPTDDRLAPALTGLTAAKTLKRGKSTTIRFSLSEAAGVVIAFGQPKTGRTVNGACRKLTAKNRTKKPCTIPNTKGTLAVAGKAGANSITFKGTLATGKRLAIGKYTLTATPTDAAGNRGKPATRRLSLTR